MLPMFAPQQGVWNIYTVAGAVQVTAKGPAVNGLFPCTSEQTAEVQLWLLQGNQVGAITGPSFAVNAGKSGWIDVITEAGSAQFFCGVTVAPLVPPVIPPLPTVSANFDWEVDQGDTVAGGILTQWIDQASGFVATPPGGDSGFVVTANAYNGASGYNIPNATHALTAAAATPLNVAQSLFIVGKLDGANYGRINCSFILGSTCDVLFGQAFYFTGASNVTGAFLPAQAPFVFDYEFTPGSGSLVGFYNGWPVSTASLNAITDFTGTPPALGAASNVQLGPFIAGPPSEWGGDFQTGAQWPQLSPTDRAQAQAHYIAKNRIPQGRGYMTCGAEALPYNALTTFLNLVLSYAKVRLYTTSSSFTIDVQNQVTAGADPPSPTGIVVVIDRVYDHTIPIADEVSPYPPTTYPVTSTRLADGKPHLVELWHGTQGTAAVGEEGQGEVICRVQDPTGNTLIYPANVNPFGGGPTPPTRMMVVEGDSNTLGFGVGTNDPALGGFQLLRLTPGQWNGEIAFWSTFGRTVFIEQQFGFANTADRIGLLLDEGGGGLQVVVNQLGLNDFNSATYLTAADFGTGYGALVDAIHAARPAAIIVCLAPWVCATQAVPNANGWTLVDARAQIAAVAAARPAFCKFVDGSLPFDGAPAPNLSQLVDGFHFNTAGQATMNTWLATYLAATFP